MKILMMTALFILLITVSGLYSFIDTHVFAWIPSAWIARMQSSVVVIAVVSIIAYAALYIFYTYRQTDKTASR